MLFGRPAPNSAGDTSGRAVDDGVDEHHNGQSARRPRSSRRGTDNAQGSQRLRKDVVRRIDPWSAFKLSLVFYAALYCILMVAAVLLWTAATRTGLRENVESFVADLIASGQFRFVGGEVFRAGAVGGVILVVFGSATNLMLAVLYNIMSDLVGGLSVVVEERGSSRRRPDRPSRRATAAAERSSLLIPEAELRRGSRSHSRQRAEPSEL